MYNQKQSISLPLRYKKTCLIQQFYWHCSDANIFFVFEKVNFILLLRCNNKNKLKVILKFTLAN